MDSLRINTGAKRILINDGPAYIEFNPNDIAFVERFYRLMKDFEEKQGEYEKRSKALDENQSLDEHGIPANIVDGLALLREVCTWVRAQIDGAFGEGTSQTVFGDALTLDMFAQFFEGITPFIQGARSDKMTKYLDDNLAGRVMK